jgi:hypothetical protein
MQRLGFGNRTREMGNAPADEVDASDSRSGFARAPFAALARRSRVDGAIGIARPSNSRAFVDTTVSSHQGNTRAADWNRTRIARLEVRADAVADVRRHPNLLPTVPAAERSRPNDSGRELGVRFDCQGPCPRARGGSVRARCVPTGSSLCGGVTACRSGAGFSQGISGEIALGWAWVSSSGRGRIGTPTTK